jgi:hypothetical protein
MVSFRAILLWLMMVAVPFQAYAAAAMAICGPAPSGAAEVSAPTADLGHSHTALADDHHRDGHSASHADGAAGDHHDADHKCGNCAPCHGVGLTPSIALLDAPGLPQADLIEPLCPLASVSPSVPHKPPRA